MYACMFACLHACTHVCMHVCMSAFLCGSSLPVARTENVRFFARKVGNFQTCSSLNGTSDDAVMRTNFISLLRTINVFPVPWALNRSQQGPVQGCKSGIPSNLYDPPSCQNPGRWDSCCILAATVISHVTTKP